MDNVSPEKRRWTMSRVKSRDTEPERTLRSCLHRLGFRFRLQRRDLPGAPDLVLPKYRVALFVHGCFWHQHEGCRRSRRPTTNVEYWTQKLTRNMERDRRVRLELEALGYRVIVVWECEMRDMAAFAPAIALRLRGTDPEGASA